MSHRHQDGAWDLVIGPKRGLWNLGLMELWDYRDLLLLFIKRDIVIVYKQTIFGPVWYFVQPLLTMIVYIAVFSNIARIPTDGLPPPLFYLAGIIMWNYFHASFIQTSDVFHTNAAIFEKVYFPRVTLPLAKVITGIIQFCIQASLFAAVLIYYYSRGLDLNYGSALALVPFLLLLTGGLAMGAGLVFSALTAKYRDLKFLVASGVQLLMYATPVIYPLSIVPERFRAFVAWNPLVHIMEGFRLAVLGSGTVSITGLLYTALFTLSLLTAGLLMFTRTEQTFADTV